MLNIFTIFDINIIVFIGGIMKNIFKIIILIVCVLMITSFLIMSFGTLNISSKNEKINLTPLRVIFTFDDGPNKDNETTERLLDIFNKYQIKGVFCLLGVNVKKYPKIVKRIYNEGHIIVNHGFSDKIAYFMNDDEFRENLILGEKAITEALGFELFPKLYRPQGGMYNKKKESILIEEGYIIVPFTSRVMEPYSTHKNYEKKINKIIDILIKQNGGMILLHDGRDSWKKLENELNKKPDGAYNRSWIPEAVEKMIIAFIENGLIVNEQFDLEKILR